MKWKVPPAIKVYEALGTIGDSRIEITGSKAKVYSSSRGKYYSVSYDAESNSIMCNDNGSYYVGYLGYPAVAFLMKIGELDYPEEYATALKGIAWKDLNVKHDKNKGKGSPRYDYDAVIKEVDELLVRQGIDLPKFKAYVDGVLEQIKAKGLNLLGRKELPPTGY